MRTVPCSKAFAAPWRRHEGALASGGASDGDEPADGRSRGRHAAEGPASRTLRTASGWESLPCQRGRLLNGVRPPGRCHRMGRRSVAAPVAWLPVNAIPGPGGIPRSVPVGSSHHHPWPAGSNSRSRVIAASSTKASRHRSLPSAPKTSSTPNSIRRFCHVNRRAILHRERPKRVTLRQHAAELALGRFARVSRPLQTAVERRRASRRMTAKGSRACARSPEASLCHRGPEEREVRMWRQAQE